MIRKYKAYGGILLTASHNPGGPNNDFGIKYNVSNGGPAPESVTDKIFAKTKTITSYKVIELPPVDLSKIGTFEYGPSKVEIIDSVKDYVELLESIFDFDLIKSFLVTNADKFSVLFDGMHGVTGPYGRAIFVDKLGLPATSVQNAVPLPDFGGGHPDPNLTYAHELVENVEKNNIQFGAASDGDGDRNMIYGKGAFVTPSDSVAIIADWAEEAIPYFKSGVKGVARSMPTSKQIEYVAKKKGLKCYEVPTGECLLHASSLPVTIIVGIRRQFDVPRHDGLRWNTPLPPPIPLRVTSLFLVAYCETPHESVSQMRDYTVPHTAKGVAC